MTDLTTSQLSTILSALAGTARKPATKTAATRAIDRHAVSIGLTSEAVLAAAPGLLDGRLDPAAWREQLTTPVPPVNVAEEEGSARSEPTVSILRSGTKQALIAGLLGRKQGATLDELIAATGWLPHTTRAALTGLRHKGCTLEKSTRKDGKTVYRIVPPGKTAGRDAASSKVA